MKLVVAESVVVSVVVVSPSPEPVKTTLPLIWKLPLEINCSTIRVSAVTEVAVSFEPSTFVDAYKSVSD